VLRCCVPALRQRLSNSGSVVFDWVLMGRNGGTRSKCTLHLQPWLEPLANLFADRTQAACVEDVCLDHVLVKAGNIIGLASVFAVKGEAQMALAASPLL